MYEYCIIGAGPGGLQLGQLLLEQGVDYVVLDKAAAAGSFYEQYPRHRCCMRSAEFSPPTTTHMRHYFPRRVSTVTLELAYS